MTMPDHDTEKGEPPSRTVIDIEHTPVEDDPRKWSSFRKNIILILVSSGSMIAGLAVAIQNPAIEEMEVDLSATSSEISLSMSLFIIFQGSVPLLWGALSELKGRKLVYTSSLAIFVVGCIAVAVSKNIESVIGLRCLQAVGSAAVMTLGAATLADIFDPHERGRKMGIYYIAPLLGPSLGPILGGALTTGFDWRAPFWFLAILGGSVFTGFMIFFKETFRKERSSTYQSIVKQRLKAHVREMSKKGSISTVTTPSDLLASLPPVELTWRDFNPARPIWLALYRMHNVVILVASAMLFGYAYVIAYASARTLGTFYHYNPLRIGLVLLPFGIGSLIGSVAGGRWSDFYLARLKDKNNGQSFPEMRLSSIKYAVWTVPAVTIAYGWASYKLTHVAVLCVLLFFCGLTSIFVYSSTLPYIVDSNLGRSSVIISINSFVRGLMGLVCLELAVPLQDGLGDGWAYTILGGAMALSALCTNIVEKRGKKWRENAQLRDTKRETDDDSKISSALATPSGDGTATPIHR